MKGEEVRSHPAWRALQDAGKTIRIATDGIRQLVSSQQPELGAQSVRLMRILWGLSVRCVGERGWADLQFNHLNTRQTSNFSCS